MGFEGFGFGFFCLKCITFQGNAFWAAGNRPPGAPNPTPYLEGSFRVPQRAFCSLYVTCPQPYALFGFGTFLSPSLQESVFSLAECFLSLPQAVTNVCL